MMYYNAKTDAIKLNELYIQPTMSEDNRFKFTHFLT